MAYAITQACCNDAICAAICPVACIHPTPDEPGYEQAEMLYINPAECIDCEACVVVCPVDAIHRVEELPVRLQRYAAINADFFRGTQQDAP
jgi:ferredoxin--NADP+ reductase